MKKANVAIRVFGVILLIAVIIFYDAVTPLVIIPAISLSFILMLGRHSNSEESRYSNKQRERVINSASAGIKWTQSPILWMVILIVFGGILSLLL
jgi:hypothetical protein